MERSRSHSNGSVSSSRLSHRPKTPIIKQPPLDTSAFFKRPTAIAIWPFKKPGATNCTKVQVFRPKSAAPNGLQREKLVDEILTEQARVKSRPQTAKNWKRPLAEIDYAIGWDLRSTPGASEEADDDADVVDAQQKDRHQEDARSIRGGSDSPDSGVQSPSLASSRSSRSMPVDRRSDAGRSSRRSSEDPKQDGRVSLDSGRSSMLSSPMDRARSVPDLHHLIDAGVQTEQEAEAVGKLKRVKTARACIACEVKDAMLPQLEKKRTEESGYKYAFLCGRPGNNRPQTVNPAALEKYRRLKVKKAGATPATPGGMKKSHSINTLAPPFSTYAKLTPHDIPTRLNTIYNISYSNSSKLLKGPSLNRLYKY